MSRKQKSIAFTCHAIRIQFVTINHVPLMSDYFCMYLVLANNVKEEVRFNDSRQGQSAE